MVIEKEWLEEQYVTNRKKQSEIAEMTNVSHATIYLYMKKYGIKSREQYRWNTKNHPVNKNRELFCERSRKRMTKMQEKKHAWKQEIHLTERQRQIILGSLLGDMSILIPNKAKNAQIREEHSIKQKKYLTWKQNELQSLLKHEMTTRHVKSNKGEIDAVRIYSMCLPCLNEINELTRNGKKKLITDKWLTECNEIALAVWMMDDGSSGKHQFNFAVGKINDDEVSVLQNWLKTKFNIESTIDKGRPNNRRLRITGRKNLQSLYDNAAPTIEEIPSMKYKLEFMIYNEPCTHEVIHDGRCKKCGRIVSKTNHDSSKHIDEDELIRMYTTTNKTMKELSNMFNISDSTIYNRLHNKNIKTRTTPTAKLLVKIDNDWLLDQYITKNKSQREIAEMTNVSQTTISKKLNQCGIHGKKLNECTI